jgi:hypothetical protein
MPMAAGRRLSGRRREAVVLCARSVLRVCCVLRARGQSARTGSGKNKQSTKNETRSCFRQFPLASLVIASPSNHRPAHPKRPGNLLGSLKLKKILQRKHVVPPMLPQFFLLEFRATSAVVANDLRRENLSPWGAIMRCGGGLSASEPGRDRSGRSRALLSRSLALKKPCSQETVTPSPPRRAAYLGTSSCPRHSRSKNGVALLRL